MSKLESVSDQDHRLEGMLISPLAGTPPGHSTRLTAELLADRRQVYTRKETRLCALSSDPPTWCEPPQEKGVISFLQLGRCFGSSGFDNDIIDQDQDNIDMGLGVGDEDGECSLSSMNDSDDQIHNNWNHINAAEYTPCHNHANDQQLSDDNNHNDLEFDNDNPDHNIIRFFSQDDRYPNPHRMGTVFSPEDDHHHHHDHVYQCHDEDYQCSESDHLQREHDEHNEMQQNQIEMMRQNSFSSKLQQKATAESENDNHNNLNNNNLDIDDEDGISEDSNQSKSGYHKRRRRKCQKLDLINRQICRKNFNGSRPQSGSTNRSYPSINSLNFNKLINFNDNINTTSTGIGNLNSLNSSNKNRRIRYKLAKRHQIIGSDPQQCDVVIPSLAPKHAALAYHRSGKPYLCFFEPGELLDQGSSEEVLDNALNNSTTVNSVIHQYEEISILPQKLRLGDSFFLLTGRLLDLKRSSLSNTNYRKRALDEPSSSNIIGSNLNNNNINMNQNLIDSCASSEGSISEVQAQNMAMASPSKLQHRNSLSNISNGVFSDDGRGPDELAGRQTKRSRISGENDLNHNHNHVITSTTSSANKDSHNNNITVPSSKVPSNLGKSCTTVGNTNSITGTGPGTSITTITSMSNSSTNAASSGSTTLSSDNLTDSSNSLSMSTSSSGGFGVNSSYSNRPGLFQISSISNIKPSLGVVGPGSGSGTSTRRVSFGKVE